MEKALLPINVEPSKTLFQNSPHQPEVEMDSTKRAIPSSIKIFPHSIHPLRERIIHEIKMKIPLPQGPNYHFPLPVNAANCLSDDVNFIDCIDDLSELSTLLSSSTGGILSVDLEAHSFESYWGMTCLIQLSYQSKTFLVDAIVLKDAIKKYLGPIFMKENLLKVMHGSKGDISWLQRDFDCHIYPLFDTQIALKYLNLDNSTIKIQLSLTSLLERYSNITLEKGYQLSDWRRRPLSQEMLAYAQGDTMYLEYLFNKLREELGEEKSKEAFHNSLQSSIKEWKWNHHDDSGGGGDNNSSGTGWTEDSYLSILRKEIKNQKLISESLKKICKRVFKWREYCCRVENSSPYSILPHHLCVRLAKAIDEGNSSSTEDYLRNWGKIPFWSAIKHLNILLDFEFEISLPSLEEMFMYKVTSQPSLSSPQSTFLSPQLLRRSPTIKREKISLSKPNFITKKGDNFQLNSNVDFLREKVNGKMLINSNTKFIKEKEENSPLEVVSSLEDVSTIKVPQEEEFIINGKIMNLEDIVLGTPSTSTTTTTTTSLSLKNHSKKRRSVIDIDSKPLEEMAMEMMSSIENDNNVNVKNNISTPKQQQIIKERPSSNRLSNQPRQGNRSMTFTK